MLLFHVRSHFSTSLLAGIICYRWLDWAKGNKCLKIVSFPVPVGILPKECPSGELLDVKVFSRGPDDALYDKYQLIRQRVCI